MTNNNVSIHNSKYFNNCENNNELNSENQQEKNYPIQLYQLIAYFNFQIKLNKELLEETDSNKNFNNNIKLCLIDNSWLQKWKEEVRYFDIKKEYDNKQLYRELKISDYKWIKLFINYDEVQIESNPFDNKAIFNDNYEINPLADFEIVDDNCYKLFSTGCRNTKNLLMEKDFEIKIFKQKILIKLNENNYSLKFKDKLNNYGEILITFSEGNNNDKNDFLYSIMEKDINNINNIDIFLKENNITDNYGIKIINKTSIKKNEQQLNINNITNSNILREEQENSKNYVNKNNLNNNNVEKKTEDQKEKNIYEKRYNMVEQENKENKKEENENKKYNQESSISSNINEPVRNTQNTATKNEKVKTHTKSETFTNAERKSYYLFNNSDQIYNTYIVFNKPINKENKNINNGLNNSFNIFNENALNNMSQTKRLMNNDYKKTKSENILENNNQVLENNKNWNMSVNQNEEIKDFTNDNLKQFNLSGKDNTQKIFNNINNESSNSKENQKFINENILDNGNNNLNNINNNYNNQNNDYLNMGSNQINNAFIEQNNNSNCNYNNFQGNYFEQNNQNNQYINGQNFNNNQNCNIFIQQNFQNNFNQNNNEQNIQNNYNFYYNNNIQLSNQNNLNNNNESFNNMQGQINGNICQLNNVNNFQNNNCVQNSYMNQINNNNNCNNYKNNNNFNNENNINNNNNNFNNININNNNQNNILINNFINGNNIFLQNMQQQYLVINNLLNNNLNFINMKKNQNNNLNKNRPLYPHRTGLMNIMQTCYMNASIQCLSNISSFSNKLLKSLGSFDRQRQPLTYEYSNLLNQLIYSNAKYIEPKSFKSVIDELNPLFAGNHASDAKDLLFFIIDRLHQELIPPEDPQNVNHQNNQPNFLQLELDSQDENKTLKKFIKELNGKNSSIVSETFNGISRNTMLCFGCKRTKYSFQTFNIVNFILKKIRDDKIMSLGEYYDGIDIYDAFDSDKKEEIFVNENMIFCNFCHRLNSAKHQQLIYGLPSVLILVLNRGKNNQDFDEEFKFYETLDFTGKNYIINNNSYQRFFLCGIITHLGESGTSGHFIAYCRTNINDRFTCYNDTIISDASVSSAMKTNISYNDFEKKTPYILFYHHY